MSSLTFLLTVLRIYAYSIHCLSSPFSTISRRFLTRARVGDDILDFSGLLVALATLDVICWIMSVMTLPMAVFFLSTSTSNLMLLITILLSLQMLTG